MSLSNVITIDGPAGTGKSVTAKDISKRLNLVYLDSGALYRTVALAIQRSGITDPDDPALSELISHLEIKTEPTPAQFRVFIAEEEVTDQIRHEKVSQNASRFATNADVRALVNLHCRRIAAEYGCVAEGRDMGSAVFHDAELKIFLTASLDERARRRHLQLLASNSEATLDYVKEQMIERDLRDQTREIAPLCFPEDGVRVDTTYLSYDQQIKTILDLYRSGGRIRGSRFYRFIQKFSKIWFVGILGARITGLEQIPRGASIVASNHSSNTDPPLIGGIMPCAIAFMAKEELFRPRFQGTLISNLCAIPIRRGKVDRTALRACLKSIHQAIPLLMFPQGTRVKTGASSKAHTGVAWLARKAQVPVVPARIISSGSWKSFLRISPIEVVFGQPLTPAAEDARGEDSAFTGRVMDAIHSLSGGAKAP